MQCINTAFGFVIGFEQSASLSVTLLRNGQTGATMAINCGTKIATNAFLSEISKMGFLWSANPSKTFLIARVWRTLPRRSNFSRNRRKSHKIVAGVNFNTTWHCYSPHSILVNWQTVTQPLHIWKKTAEINVKILQSLTNSVKAQ